MKDGLAARFATLAFAGFTVGYLALHIASWGEWPHHASSYAKTDWAWLWDSAMWLMGLGAFALAFALRGEQAKGTAVARGLLVSAGVLAFLLVAYPTERGDDDRPHSVQGQLHDLAATTAVSVLVAAMYILSAAGRASERWRRLAGTSFAWPHGLMAMGLGWLVLDRLGQPLLAGLVQRVLVLLVVLWLLALSRKAVRESGDIARSAGASADPES